MLRIFWTHICNVQKYQHNRISCKWVDETVHSGVQFSHRTDWGLSHCLTDGLSISTHPRPFGYSHRFGAHSMPLDWCDINRSWQGSGSRSQVANMTYFQETIVVSWKNNFSYFQNRPHLTDFYLHADQLWGKMLLLAGTMESYANTERKYSQKWQLAGLNLFSLSRRKQFYWPKLKPGAATSMVSGFTKVKSLFSFSSVQRKRETNYTLVSSPKSLQHFNNCVHPLPPLLDVNEAQCACSGHSAGCLQRV